MISLKEDAKRENWRLLIDGVMYMNRLVGLRKEGTNTFLEIVGKVVNNCRNKDEGQWIRRIIDVEVSSETLFKMEW